MTTTTPQLIAVTGHDTDSIDAGYRHLLEQPQSSSDVVFKSRAQVSDDIVELAGVEFFADQVLFAVADADGVRLHPLTRAQSYTDLAELQ